MRRNSPCLPEYSRFLLEKHSLTQSFKISFQQGNEIPLHQWRTNRISWNLQFCDLHHNESRVSLLRRNHEPENVEIPWGFSVSFCNESKKSSNPNLIWFSKVETHQQLQAIPRQKSAWSDGVLNIKISPKIWLFCNRNSIAQESIRTIHPSLWRALQIRLHLQCNRRILSRSRLRNDQVEFHFGQTHRFQAVHSVFFSPDLQSREQHLPYWLRVWRTIYQACPSEYLHLRILDRRK